MTDILGDIRTIIAAKRPDTAFLFFTDGLTWKQRKSDLRKLVEFQNNGDITRIYTYAMAQQFERTSASSRRNTSCTSRLLEFEEQVADLGSPTFRNLETLA